MMTPINAGLTATVLLAICAAGPTFASPASDEVRVEILLHKMTLDEKVGQLVQFSSGT